MSPFTETDLILINRGGVDYQTTLAELREYVNPPEVFEIDTPVEWEFNAANVPVVTKDATTKNGVDPISMVESIEYEIDNNPLTHGIPNTSLEMNYFAPQNIFVCPYGQRDTREGPNQGIDHFSIDTNTFSTTYSHPDRGSCRHGSFLAKSKEHEYVGVLFSYNYYQMQDGCMVVTNENGVEKIYPESELPAKKVTNGTKEYLPTKFFFKTVGNDDYMYISWYSRGEESGSMSYISRTKNPVQFDSEGFPIIPVDINEHEFKIQVPFDGYEVSLTGAILGGEYSEIEGTLYTMARNCILAYKIDESGEIEDAIEYPTEGGNQQAARITVTKNYILKKIIPVDGYGTSSVSINKSTGVETRLNTNFVHVATADGSRIFRLQKNQVIQYMEYDETGDPADDSTWHEYEPTKGQLLPNQEFGGYGVVKENPFSLVWDDRANQLYVWGSKPLSGSEACVIQTFTDSAGDTCESNECKTVP